MYCLIDKLIFYFQYPFVRYALIVGVLIALCSSLLGVTLVLKRFSFIGDGLSHVAFGAMAVASILNFTNNMIFILPVTVICAVLLLRTGQNTKIKGDAAIAMISVGALAIGYLLMNLFATGPNLSGDVCSTLFGSTSILTLTKEQVVLCSVLSVIVVVVFVIFYYKIFCITFDETFAKATGMKTDFYNLFPGHIGYFVHFGNRFQQCADSHLSGSIICFSSRSACSGNSPPCSQYMDIRLLGDSSQCGTYQHCRHKAEFS